MEFNSASKGYKDRNVSTEAKSQTHALCSCNWIPSLRYMTLRQLVIEFRRFKATTLLDYRLTQCHIPEVNSQIYRYENIQSRIGPVCVWSRSAPKLEMFRVGSSHNNAYLLLKAVIISVILEEDIRLCRYCNISHNEKVSAQRMLSVTNIWFEKDTHPAAIRTPQAGMSRMSLILKIIM